MSMQSEDPLQLYFTLSAGRTGTKFLSSLFKQNAPFPELPIYHEQFNVDSLGQRIPDLSHLLQFNNRGNTKWVQKFWERKWHLIQLQAHRTGYYVETSHRLFKAGLVENLAELADPEQHTVHLIDLRRSVLPTLLSYHSRADLLNYENRAQWYLDSQYDRNMVAYQPYQSLPISPAMQQRLWYLHEIHTRSQYYRFKYHKHPLFQFHRFDLEDLNHTESVRLLFRDTQWPLPSGNINVPDPKNKTDQASRHTISGDELDKIKQILEQADFSPQLVARNILKKESRPPRIDHFTVDLPNQDWSTWLQRRYLSESSPIFIGGSPRSGTTLLRVMLDTHAQLCCGPESNLLRIGERAPFESITLPQLTQNFDIPQSEIQEMYHGSDSLAHFMDLFFERYRSDQQAEFWVEKTPQNVRQIPYIFGRFPKARFIHVIRDGRDVSKSLEHFPRHKVVDGQIVDNQVTNPIDQCAQIWANHVIAGLEHRNDPRYIEVRYENLVEHPQATLQQLCADLELEFDPAMLNYHEVDSNSRDATRFPQNPEATQPIYQSAKQRWKQELTEQQVHTIYDVAGDLLQLLGYWDGSRD